MASLATAMTAGDGVAVLSAAVNFASLPAPITIDSENLLVTSGDNLATISVSRGQNGTAAASHAIGTTVTLGWGGAGTVTPAAHVDPQTATPQQIAEALIAAGLMEDA